MLSDCKRNKKTIVNLISIIIFLASVCLFLSEGSGEAKESVIRVIYSGNHFGEIEPCG